MSKYIKDWEGEHSQQVKQRIEKREKMIEEGLSPYKGGNAPGIRLLTLREKYNDHNADQLEALGEENFHLVGRVLFVRSFGKAAFVKIDDGTESMQLYVQKAALSEDCLKEYKLLDIGDIISTSGTLFRTKKGELSLNASSFNVLSKALRPLPEKYHGLTDPELKYRMRYVDMIMDTSARDRFKKRSFILNYIRSYFHQLGYYEVETPMLHSVAGGATAKPFETHHNSLDMSMYLRIAPELHLKRLIVGGMDRVFEMNRCFRNEGLSMKHNPEFTTIEFYQAYANYRDFMALTEDLLQKLVRELNGGGTLEIEYEGRKISFEGPFTRISMRDAVAKYCELTVEETHDRSKLLDTLANKGMEGEELRAKSNIGLMVMCFEELVEPYLVNPTFVTNFPTEVSPLARRSDENPEETERFELYINGWEIANAFSELSDPIDQLHRFAKQAELKDAGDEEATSMDYDFVRALEYGMPPTAGEGIGIDRLCMILLGVKSIRDILLFPQLKQENFGFQS